MPESALRLAATPAAPPAQDDASGQLLLTPPEAAKALAVSPRTLWGLTASGQVPSVRIGRAVRYARADLLAYVERLRAQTK